MLCMCTVFSFNQFIQILDFLSVALACKHKSTTIYDDRQGDAVPTRNLYHRLITKKISETTS